MRRDSEQLSPAALDNRTMPKYVAFLRAINVGGHTVKMDQLRSLFEAAGFSNVETFIASGNVIFDSKSKNTLALEQKIEKHLQQNLGYEVATFIRATTDLPEIIQRQPFGETSNSEDGVVYIGFLAETPGHEVIKKLRSLATGIDDFRIEGREVYWLCRAQSFSDSGFSGAKLEKTLGMKTTLRNSNTVQRLVAKYP